MPPQYVAHRRSETDSDPGSGWRPTDLAPRSERSCRLVDWKPWPFDNPSLLGHVTISFTGWVIGQVPIFRRADGGLSAGVPGAAQIDGEGRIKVRDGKRQYTALVTFEGTDARERWQRSVLNALADGGIHTAEDAADRAA